MKKVKSMKINRLETHDRFEHFKKNQKDLDNFLQKVNEERPFGLHPFYVFIIHKKTLGLDEKLDLVKKNKYLKLEDTPEALMAIQARLSKPQAAPNTTLIKIYPAQEYCKVIWTLPQQELWDQFLKDTIFNEDELTLRSILAYLNDRRSLEAYEADDPKSEEEFYYLRKIAEGKSTFVEIPIYANSI